LTPSVRSGEVGTMTESTSRGAARPLRRDPAEDGTPAAPSSREGPASFDFEPRPIPPALPRSAPFPRRVVRWVVRIGYGLWIHDATSAANSMAFNFFLSVIPLLVLVGFLLGHFVRKNGVDEFMGPLLEVIPAGSGDLIRHELERLAESGAAGSVAPLSIAGFLWLTTSGTHHMMDVFERVVRAPRRSWWKQRAIALATVLMGLVATCATTWAVLAADASLHGHEAPGPATNGPKVLAAPPPTTATTTHVSHEREPASAHHERKRLLARVHAVWENYVAIATMLLVGVCGLAAFYRYAVEHPPGIRRRAWPGACVAVAAWLGCSWSFGNYVISLGKYAVYYGSLAAVAVLLVWLWLTSLSLLLGAELNAQLEGVRR